jgi:hypothetical protein
LKALDTKTLFRLNNKAVSLGYNAAINWHGAAEDGVDLIARVSIEGHHLLVKRLVHGVGTSGVHYRCALLLNTGQAEPERLRIDVDADDYEALPDAAFVSLMNEAFPNRRSGRSTNC